jgi:hypothetical protein
VVYEIRVYEAHEGKLDVLRARFLNEVAPRLSQHGIELVGVFDAPIPDGKLTYITRFTSEEARVAGWASFSADADWKAIKTSSEVNGPLLARQTLSVLTPAVAGLPLA